MNHIKSYLLKNDLLWKTYLKLFKSYSINNYSVIPGEWFNASLKSSDEIEMSVKIIKSLGLPIVEDRPKNWDSLVMLDAILSRINKESRILDAGAEIYSKLLPWLSLYGYKNLYGINLVFNKEFYKGPIKYSYGDITNTKFDEAFFDAIFCQSVIEHGVDLTLFFKEMSRLLKPNGILLVSTDYFDVPIDTTNLKAYDVQIKIFSPNEINNAIRIAGSFNLRLIKSLDLNCKGNPVRWERYNLKYTFINFILQKNV